jgi:nucleoside-diphosphate-sugar epimerase
VAGTALITGATGLIGASLLTHWDDTGLEPVTVDRSLDDLLVPGTATALVARVQPDVVVHLAWVASGTPAYRSSPDNARWLDASLELAAACLERGSLLLATGTSLEHERAASDAYTSSKNALWQALSGRVATGQVGWLRPFYVFDPARRRPAVVEHAIAARDDGRAVVLQTPHSRHDFVHVDDVATAIVSAASHRLTGELEIGSGVLHAVHELVEALGVSWQPGAAPPATAIPQAHDAADVARLVELGWAPTTTEEFFAGD